MRAVPRRIKFSIVPELTKRDDGPLGLRKLKVLVIFVTLPDDFDARAKVVQRCGNDLQANRFCKGAMGKCEMDANEQDVTLYLKGWPGQFVSLALISRHAVSRKRYNRELGWALPILSPMAEKGFIGSDSAGHYRLRPPQEKRKFKRWVSPQIRKILQKSGKDYSGVFDLGELDDHSNLEPPA